MSRRYGSYDYSRSYGENMEGCIRVFVFIAFALFILAVVIEAETGFFRWLYREFKASWWEYQQIFNEWFGLASVLLSQFT